MNTRTTFFIKKFVVPTIVWLMFVFTWAEFFAKPFVNHATRDEGSWTESIRDLFRLVPEAFGWPLAGYLFLAISALVSVTTLIFALRPIRVFIKYLEVAESPISIIRSHFKIQITKNGAYGEINRTQYVHANRPNVNAYNYSLAPIYGSIEMKEISSYLGSRKITSNIKSNIIPSRSDYIEEFESPLPLSFFITYFFDSWVYWTHIHWGWFKKTLVKRNVVTVETDEYNQGIPTFEATARYPVSGVSISLEFPQDEAPPLEDIDAYFMDEGAIKKLDIVSTYENGNRIFSMDFGKLKSGQKLRVNWPCPAKS